MEAFWVTLALRVVVTAAIVIAAALAAERAGPLWGGLIATLPVSAGPAFVMLSMQQDSVFIAQAALGGIAANPATVAFGVVVVRLLPVAGLWVALSLALVAWLGVVVTTRLLDWDIAPMVLVTAAAHLGGYWLTRGRSIVAQGVPRRATHGWHDLPVRALLVGLLVASVVTGSHALGPFLSGVFAVAPVTYTSLVLVVTARQGAEAAAAIMASALRGFAGFAFGFIALHLCAVPLGSALALLLALAVMLGWSATVILLRLRS